MYNAPVLNNQDSLLLCPNCKIEFRKGKFCIECGSPLSPNIDGIARIHTVDDVSIEEIITWIESKLAIHGVEYKGFYDVDEESSFFGEKRRAKCKYYKLVSFTTPVVILEIEEIHSFETNADRHLMPLKEPRDKQKYSIDLSKLTLDLTTEILPNAEGVRLKLQSGHNEPAIKLIVQDGEYEYEKAFVEIFINDEVMAKRIATAFHDAIKKCGGKHELY